MLFDFAWCQLMPLDASWFQLMPLDATWWHLLPLAANWCLIPFDAIWCHLMPLDATWCQLLPLDATVISATSMHHTLLVLRGIHYYSGRPSACIYLTIRLSQPSLAGVGAGAELGICTISEIVWSTATTVITVSTDIQVISYTFEYHSFLKVDIKVTASQGWNKNV